MFYVIKTINHVENIERALSSANGFDSLLYTILILQLHLNT